MAHEHEYKINYIGVPICYCDKVDPAYTLTPTQSRIMGEQGKRRGMQHVSAGASPEWKEKAYNAVSNVASREPELTTDAVWSEMGYKLNEIAPEVTPQAMGPVMRRASSDGLIALTGRTKKSIRSTNHRRELTIWRSLVNRGAGSTKPCPDCSGTGRVNG